ncbi:GNAT family N-acetyltransferase [Paenibacillus sp. UMB7766-LJ446]|uniref:GNAT family N-acetyltransferase n=1 Tax=Paenibacillus sp. UMB7766-LJ446 TaxID=3046313 RepID=UPI00254D8990|nr:GNAT family N-acetyltransferase [Paenibacillus sp. UMB7766-LJ446]MDK8193874.1 GNAT family N-acetyltransferase [Paenibacillus sp. UMB7766-LJ446]
MIIDQQEFNVKGLTYSIRSAEEQDAKALSSLRVQMDGETENMDREQGEGFIDPTGFEEIIRLDTERKRNLFLVALVKDQIVGYSRCEGVDLKRFSHKVEFGVCVSKKFWGYGIGKKLLALSIEWADTNGIEKMSLNVVGTNDKAMELYKGMGFEIEGTLKKDRRHADGRYYDTVMMGRFRG